MTGPILLHRDKPNETAKVDPHLTVRAADMLTDGRDVMPDPQDYSGDDIHCSPFPLKAPVYLRNLRRYRHRSIGRRLPPVNSITFARPSIIRSAMSPGKTPTGLLRA